MKNILNKISEVAKVNKKKIIKIGVTLGVVGVVSVGALGWMMYSFTKTNINYDQSKAQEIALKKIPGDIVKVENELDFDSATLEYEFEIKDKENMLKKIAVSSKSGAIIDIDDECRERD